MRSDCTYKDSNFQNIIFTQKNSQNTTIQVSWLLLAPEMRQRYSIVTNLFQYSKTQPSFPTHFSAFLQCQLAEQLEVAYFEAH